MRPISVLVLALTCAVISLPGLWLVAWGASGGDGEEPSLAAGVLAWLLGLASLASVAAGIRQVTIAPTQVTVAVMRAPPAVGAVVGCGTVCASRRSTSRRLDPVRLLTAVAE